MTRVFVSTWGQNDNLGDSVLRRGLLEAVQPDDGKAHVFIGGNDDGYLTALGLRGDEVLYRSRSKWWQAAFSHLLLERTVLVQTAGELVFEGARPYAGWRTILGVGLASLRGGAGLQVGAGVRNPSTPVPALERRARRRLSVVAWRDFETQKAFGTGDVAPDWAFAEGSDLDSLHGLTTSRDEIVVSTRGDRPALASATVDQLRDLADRHGLRLHVVTQVRRDETRARELAESLGEGTRLTLWRDESHAEWETVVRRIYGGAAIVASDRAHVLIIGATEGALPLGVSGSSIEKVRRLLAPAGFVLPKDAAEVDPYVQEALSTDTYVLSRIATAKQALASTQAKVTAVVRGA
ncbi:MAG: hypothetical protein K0S37_4644 [Microbacterium sp.]|nr:hypothetical protein [Microbacterium sp.]